MRKTWLKIVKIKNKITHVSKIVGKLFVSLKNSIETFRSQKIKTNHEKSFKTSKTLFQASRDFPEIHFQPRGRKKIFRDRNIVEKVSARLKIILTSV